MCLGGGGGGYMPAPIKRPVYQSGPESPHDMVNNQVIDNVNPRDQQEEARGGDPPIRPQTQSSLALGGTTTPTPQRKSSRMGVAKRTARNKARRKS